MYTHPAQKYLNLWWETSEPNIVKCTELEMQPLEGMASVGTVDGIYQNSLILLFITFGFLFPFFFLSFFFWKYFRNKSDFVVQHKGILTTG